MVYSASAMISLKETANSADGATQFSYFFKQFGFTVFGLVVMYVTSKIDYKFYRNRYVVIGLLAGTAVLLIAVFGFGAINGARRWIRFGGASFQPSEIAKIALPVFLAWFLTIKEKAVGELKETLRLARREMALTQQVRVLEGVRKLFGWWHVAHRPFAITALLAVLAHVVIAIVVGAVGLP